MLTYNSQKEKEKRNKICREKIAASIISEAERRKAYEEKRLHLTDNQDRLKKYIAELRSTYAGDILLFLENNAYKSVLNMSSAVGVSEL